ncbi:hypothetical protein [Janthinobacterium sp. B9-8]|uniref:hypothetical protein n=1 Tax=Janthinobacterium sp. B9-8 TaxID=1236179 RepID=UPI00061D1F30|nr:hypothetical protein [Janthinobacterium sp. B9-8]AMC36360.1 hypothetical protein VN23_18065 [Janthinobacterium sp. B9-8]
MNILFLTELKPELSSDFRNGSVKDYIFQMNNMVNAIPDIECRLLIAEETADSLASENNKIVHNFKTHVVSAKQVDNILNSDSLSENWYNKAYSEEQLNDIAHLLRKITGDFIPDAVIIHESHAPYAKLAWPNAVVLHQMFGLTYRAPYPQLTQYDPSGLYNNSILVKDSEKIKSITLSENEKKTIKEIKGWFATQTIAHDPLWLNIEPWQHRFDKLILCPLQVDGYYAFDACSEYNSQLEFLEDVLSKTPKNWGVVVTEHLAYTELLTSPVLARLKREYSNLVYLPESKKVPNASQALLVHMDAIVTVSSSLAYQAMFFDIPVISAGKSHINAFSTCSLENIENTFKDHNGEIFLPVLFFLLTRLHHVRKTVIDNGAAHYSLISTIVNNVRNGCIGIDALPVQKNLDEVFKDLKNNSQWKIWSRELENKQIKTTPNPALLNICFADAISWDLFDTLVQRPFIQPHELFQAIEPIVRKITKNIYIPFHHLRREAERLARSEHNHRIEITFDEIYHQFERISGLEPHIVSQIKETEIKAELNFIQPKNGMLRTWRMAGCFGKPRSIITDIYFSQEIIEEILRKNGLTNYDILLVSSELRIRKEDGTMYPHYLSQVRRQFPKSETLLHIGDNNRADGEMASRHGIKTLIIPKSIDLLKQTALGKMYAAPLASLNAMSSAVIGLTANRFFSSPNTGYNKESAVDANLFDFGYAMLGPFVVGYTQWVQRRLKALKADNAYFLARDAYLPMRVYEILKDDNDGLPEAQYLYCSRRSAVVPALAGNPSAVKEIATLNFGTMPLNELLSSRFGLSASDLSAEKLIDLGLRADGKSKVSYPRDIPLVNKVINAFMPEIENQSQKEKKTYLRYLSEIGITDPNMKSALIDIGYSGTMQRKMTELTGINYHGLYVLTHDYVIHTFKDETFEGWLASFDNQRSSIRHDTNNYIPLLESLLSSEEASLVCYEENNKGDLIANFLEVSNEKDRVAFIRQLHQGALQFAKDWKSTFGSLDKDAFELSPAISSYPLLQTSRTPNEHDMQIFQGLILENLFAGAEFNVISDPSPYLDKSGKLNRQIYERLISESKWKEGAIAAYKKYLIQTNVVADRITSTTTAPEITINHSAKPTINKNSSLTNKEKRRIKLIERPDRFFADSQHVILRPLQHLFGKNATGAVMHKLLLSIISNKKYIH